jgi:hypothetical protein
VQTKCLFVCENWRDESVCLEVGYIVSCVWCRWICTHSNRNAMLGHCILSWGFTTSRIVTTATLSISGALWPWSFNCDPPNAQLCRKPFTIPAWLSIPVRFFLFLLGVNASGLVVLLWWFSKEWRFRIIYALRYRLLFLSVSGALAGSTLYRTWRIICVQQVKLLLQTFFDMVKGKYGCINIWKCIN